ncbi:MAG: hypothetical protein HY660_06265, partial [Armatimonadetes bacterium]|nr:hypothetical protein [Armatimonadota bacterium]
DEQLKRQLRYKMGTSGWITLAKKRPEDLIEFLEREFGLLGKITRDRERAWTFADLVVERYVSSRTRASGAVLRGRILEDAVEQVLKELGLSYRMRTKFLGVGNADAPCDFAIPAAGGQAKIVGAAKGFDSTGSKLADAVREIESMARTRLPIQFVFAVVDGIGWLGREADLRRIFQMWRDRRIDGLYSLGTLDGFREDIRRAALRLSLLQV